MLDRSIKNMPAIQLYLSSVTWRADQTPIAFTAAEIELMKAVRAILRPLFNYSKMLQDRRTSIAVVIPTFVVLKSQLESLTKEPNVVRAGLTNTFEAVHLAG